MEIALWGAVYIAGCAFTSALVLNYVRGFEYDCPSPLLIAVIMWPIVLPFMIPICIYTGMSRSLSPGWIGRSVDRLLQAREKKLQIQNQELVEQIDQLEQKFRSMER